MKNYDFNPHLLTISEEECKQFGFREKLDVRSWFDKQLQGIDPLYKEYMEIYGNQRGLKGFALLHAHGKDIQGKLYYVDNHKPISVQSWITLKEGKYKGLLICVCSPLGSKEIPYSESSPVLLSTGRVCSLEHGSFDLILSSKEIITSQTINFYLEKLKESTNQNKVA